MGKSSKKAKGQFSVNTHEAKTKLSQLLKAVETSGAIVQICRNGQPIAELVPIRKTSNPLIQDPQLSKVIFNKDPSLPATDDEWPEEYR